MAVQFWQQIVFPIYDKSYSTYTTFPLVLLAETYKKLHIKAPYRHIHRGHNMITEILLSAGYAQEPRHCLEPVCVLEKRLFLQGRVIVWSL